MSQPLEEIQDQILTALHAGDTIDRDTILVAHPEHAEALRSFFDLLDVIEGPGGGSPAPTTLGEFRIIRELGRGGMGVVYEAEQTSLKRRVALKILPPGLRMDPRLLLRFQREAEAAGRLRHPGIVPVFSVGEAAGTPFFAMERVEGRSLHEVISALREGDDADLPPAGAARIRWAVEIIAKVADALAYAHDQGILHRDVKPGNILIDTDGTPRLTDFGLALDMDAPGLTMAGETFGSPRYMSPEQAVRREAPLDERTDIYSLAVTLYELLTLRLPYDGRTTAELLTALARGKIVPPRKASPDLPAALALVLERALRKDPRERYATAAEFAVDLRAALGGERPTAAPPRRRRWSRILVRAAIAGAFLYGIAIGVKLISSGHDADLREIAISIPEIRRMAETSPPDAGEILARYMEPKVVLRPVLARSDLGNYSLRVTFNILWGGSVPRRTVIAADWEASVNGGEWVDAGTGYMSFSGNTGPEGGDRVSVARSVIVSSPLLSDILGVAADNDSIRLRHRARVRVHYEPEEEGAARGGSEWLWTSEETTCLLYDEYPENYPERVTGAEHDDAMRTSLTPERVEFGAIDSMEGRKLIPFALHFTTAAGPLAAAMEVEARHPETKAVLGRGTITVDAAAPARPGYAVTGWERLQNSPLTLEDGAGPAQAALLLDLVRGKLTEIEIVFRPSRKAALDQPTYHRYWGGELTVTVPIGKASPEEVVLRVR